jgi:hypothetical protein
VAALGRFWRQLFVAVAILSFCTIAALLLLDPAYRWQEASVESRMDANCFVDELAKRLNTHFLERGNYPATTDWRAVAAPYVVEIKCGTLPNRQSPFDDGYGDDLCYVAWDSEKQAAVFSRNVPALSTQSEATTVRALVMRDGMLSLGSIRLSGTSDFPCAGELVSYDQYTD